MKVYLEDRSEVLGVFHEGPGLMIILSRSVAYPSPSTVQLNIACLLYDK